MRGTVWCIAITWKSHRITPARAGNSGITSGYRSNIEDHPRACGEQIIFLLYLLFLLGSPPRVRGTEADRVREYRLQRITPARAGNRSHPASCSDLPWDHPRACGEQPDARLCRRDHYGSPPRVRGTGDPRGPIGRRGRITPARAGNSQIIQRGICAQKDHPRACGEQMKPFLESDGAIGSPPRVRGTETSPSPCSTGYRITPARAGNSYRYCGTCESYGDHPRACGEQVPSLLCPKQQRGSPPRVRGTEGCFPSGWTPPGITPARAGNSIPGREYDKRIGDHPRACGEQL